MKKTIYLYYSVIGIFLLLNGCKPNKDIAQKTPKGETEVIIPCSGSQYFSSTEAFRANSIGESLDQVISKKKALTNARAQLAESISTTVKTVTDNYVNSRESNNREAASERFESLNREIVNQQLSGIKVICERQTQTQEGRYKTYVALELSANDLINSYNSRLTQDEQLKVDYDYEKFKKVFEEQMKQMSDQ